MLLRFIHRRISGAIHDILNIIFQDIFPDGLLVANIQRIYIRKKKIIAGILADTSVDRTSQLTVRSGYQNCLHVYIYY